ncbi:hypothetical protein HDA32_001150 [Spinactinospora alkalitolerans]|uniref:GmrSD restriction endonucleases N-terminal domain-containing protein n=1 Tax=Spinactinospora alkalitolerans TaxID=687207 RepID=A0A852TVX1_9ACTN|nr:DUF262 domain-containing protein [Spinactinospora alkalitolerans]NYE46030.1 hypothetical protein [Spinactinospora alkalitolerans]
MTKLSTLLDHIDSGAMLLPEFQRGYVWNRDQVRGLMRSLYLNYPVGSLLVWETEVEPSSVRGEYNATGSRALLLDGQQRITSLYGVMRGRPPAFFEGDANAFTGLHFNVETEVFEFHMANKMQGDSRWVDVSRLFRRGVDAVLDGFDDDMPRSDERVFTRRLMKLHAIQERDFHEEKITGRDKTVDVVVDIFNRVNSGGTKLSKGDLALAKVCSEWPEARSVMREHLARWEEAGLSFSLDWLLRCVTAVATGRPFFSSLEDVDTKDFRAALESAVHYIGRFLDALAGRLGLDHDRVLMGRYAIPVVCRLLHLNGGDFDDAGHRDRVLYWYVHAALWGRHSGSTETMLAQDYAAAQADGVDGLLRALEKWRGGPLAVRPVDFAGSTKGSRFYPLLYLLTRVGQARDFGSGLPLHAEMLGHLTSLQVHHIFPKALLKDHYDRRQVNAVANFCFLTQDTNLKVGKQAPEKYFTEAEQKNPGVLESQWIPLASELRGVDRYEDFLRERTELLADAANRFLDELREGGTATVGADLRRVAVIEEDDTEHDARAAQITDLIDELIALGCAAPRRDVEITDPSGGRPLAVAEAYWPDGLQTGQDDPVVLELDPDEADEAALEGLGFRVFTSGEALLEYARLRNAAAAGVEGEEPSVPATEESTAEGAEAPEVLAAFDEALHSACDRAQTEAGYRAAYFRRMLEDRGALATARLLLAKPTISDGFVQLWERGRLDLTVEGVVLDHPAYARLFTPEELDIARSRIERHR